MKKKNGFTLIELLVVIGIIALLVSILMPALGKARELAKRIKCASQARSILQAMALYQNEYGDKLPVIGVKDANHSYFGSSGNGKVQLADYAASPTHSQWYNPDITVNGYNSNANAYIPSYATVSLYSLVRTQDLSPKQFLCPSDSKAEQIDLEAAILLEPTIQDYADLVSFPSGVNISYSYNDPWYRTLSGSALFGSSSVVIADMNPRYDTENLAVSTDALMLSEPDPGTGGVSAPDWTDDEGQKFPGNSFNHDTDTQNVAFADTHVDRAQSPTVGLRDDNIYSYWSPTIVNPDYDPDIGVGSWNTTSQDTMAEGGYSNAKQQDTYVGL